MDPYPGLYVALKDTHVYMEILLSTKWKQGGEGGICLNHYCFDLFVTCSSRLPFFVMISVFHICALWHFDIFGPKIVSEWSIK